MKYKITLAFLFFTLVTLSANADDNKRWIEEGNVVKDTQLGLLWQDSRSVSIREKSWYKAKQYCENLTLGKMNNWRLPTLNELLTTVDYKRSGPALIENFNNSNTKGYYWSSSKVSTDKRYAWYISIEKGNTYAYSKEEKGFIRCVHNGK